MKNYYRHNSICGGNFYSMSLRCPIGHSLKDLFKQTTSGLAFFNAQKDAYGVDLILTRIFPLIHVYFSRTGYFTQFEGVYLLLRSIIRPFMCNIRNVFTCNTLDFNKPHYPTLLGDDVDFTPWLAIVSGEYLESFAFKEFGSNILPYPPNFFSVLIAGVWHSRTIIHTFHMKLIVLRNIKTKIR